MIRAAALRRQLEREQVPRVGAGDAFPEGLSFKWVEPPHTPGPLRVSVRHGATRFVFCIGEEGGVDQLLVYDALDHS